MDRGYSTLIGIFGEMGKGKSLSGESIAMLIDPEWSKENNLFYDVKSFMRKIVKAKKTVLIIEEAGISLSANKWWDEFNKVFYQTIQVARFKACVYIVVLPLAMSLARSHRRMLDIKIVMVKKRLFRWYLVKKKWGELFGEELYDIFMGHVIVPKLDPEYIKEHKKHEKKKKMKILKDLAKEVGAYTKSVWVCEICEFHHEIEVKECPYCKQHKIKQIEVDIDEKETLE